MTELPGTVTAPLPGATVILPAAAAPAVELLTPLPVLQVASTIATTVIGRNAEGAALLQSAYGPLALKTARPLPTGARVELRYQPGNPPSTSILSVSEDAPPIDAPPTQLDLGTTTTGATVITPNPGTPEMAAGSRLLLRIAAPAVATDPATLAGQIVAGSGNDTLVETPIGTLALDLHLALPAGTAIALARLAAQPSQPQAAPPPSQAGGWPSLDQALAALDKAAPGLAQQLRAGLTPTSPATLAGTLLFLMGALYRGRWPGDAVAKALTAAGETRLKLRLGEEISDLTRLSKDPSTGSWRVMVLPYLAEASVQPLRLYLKRQDGGQDGSDDGARFVLEAEMSRLGALQLDGMMRGQRLDLVLRSHAPLAPEFRHEADAIFRAASAANGLHGDIVFATAAQFAVAPLAGLQRHVELQA